MARLNIEDQFWLDVVNVALKIGSMDIAVGNTVRFLRYVQEKHKVGSTISEEEFRDQGFSEALFPFFAKRLESGGITAVGADKHFGWLASKAEAGRRGGQISAQRPRDEHGRLQANTKQDPSTAKHHQASPSYSSSLSSSSSPSCSSLVYRDADSSNPPPEAPEKPAKAKASAAEIELRRTTWDSYRDQYLVRWGHEPVRNAAVNTQIARLVTRVGAEAPDLVRFYVKHNKPFYVEKGHAIGLCLADYQGLMTQMRVGRQFTKADARNLETSTTNQQTLEAVKAGRV